MLDPTISEQIQWPCELSADLIESLLGIAVFKSGVDSFEITKKVSEFARCLLYFKWLRWNLFFYRKHEKLIWWCYWKGRLDGGFVYTC